VGPWEVAPGVLLVLAAVGTVYVLGWRTYHRRVPARFPAWRLRAFLAGLGALWLAAASPADTLAESLLSAHMIQHILLLAVAPPLLLLGSPMLPIVRGLPHWVRRAIVRPLARWRWLRRLAGWLTHPATAFVVSSVILWAWHVPAFYDLALRSPWVHASEHALFFAGGILFWWPVVQPWPSQARWPQGAIIPYLLAADLQNTVLAAILTFSDRVLYPWYTHGALRDQMLAGVLMWVPMSVIYLVPAVVLTVRLLWPGTGGLVPFGGAVHTRVGHAGGSSRGAQDGGADAQGARGNWGDGVVHGAKGGNRGVL
jgi:putative membrane protein